MAGESDEELEEMMEEIRRQMRAEQSQPENEPPSWPSRQERSKLRTWTCCGNCQHATWQVTGGLWAAHCGITHMHQASSANSNKSVVRCQAMKPWPDLPNESQSDE